MRRRHVLACAVLCGALLVVLAQPRGDQRVALADASTVPQVSLSAPVGTGSCDECLRGTVTLDAGATAATARTITSVEFQYSPAGADAWTAIATDAVPPYSASFDTSSVPSRMGVYDIRAVATDSAAEQGSDLARDRVVANGATYVSFVEPPRLLRGEVTLHAFSPPGQNDPTEATFEYSRAGAEDWQPIATADAEFDVEGRTAFTTRFDTGTLEDGTYDLRVTARRAGSPNGRFVARPRRDKLVDTRAPTASLGVPAQPLQGEVTLTATARDERSGVASVRFERAPAGTGDWSAIGARTREPYTERFDTRVLEDGAYDLRVVAVDRAGNSAASPVSGDVEVRNPGRVPPGELSVTNLVAPARDLRLLGSAPGGETWAYGYTAAPPASVDGERLPYTASGHQLVLLRHSDRDGWQIRDVLREADGTPFELRGEDPQRTTTVIGEMAPSGEAWIAVRQAPPGESQQNAIFHRSPGAAGGEFRLDLAASATLAPLLRAINNGNEAPGDVQVRQDGGGKVYGLLVAPNQSERQTFETGAGGDPVSISEALDYGVLADGVWTLKTLPRPQGYAPREGDVLRLAAADSTGPGAGWVGVDMDNRNGAPRLPPRFGHLSDAPWDPIATGLDALDLTDQFAFDPPRVEPTELRADGDDVWIGARVAFGPKLVAFYDGSSREVTRSWCEDLGRASSGCGAPLDVDHPAAVPDDVFHTARGTVAVALDDNFLRVFSYGDWTRAAAPGFRPGKGAALLTSPENGWLAGSEAFGRVTPTPSADPLATWPQSNRSPLLAAALPAGAHGEVAEAGALAVGLDGTALRYDPATGWQVQPTPARANRQMLTSVAFSGPSHAVAVGGAGTILRWDGQSFSEDPQSTKLTQAALLSVAMKPSGEGWAVGRFGTLLHFDGSSWAQEELPPEDAQAGGSVTSVAIAGDDVFAVADGNLITRGSGGRWRRVARSELPAAPAAEALPFDGDLRLVSGLPDGGVVVAGRSVVLARQRAGERFDYAAQPIEGVAVALSAFRDADGAVRAFASSAPPVSDIAGNVQRDVAGYPAGDGTLQRQTAEGWVDLSRSQPAGRLTLPGDGLVKPDPVLALAVSRDGRRGWAVGGYAGTRTSAGQGTDEILPARPGGWRTAHIWRYDSTGSAGSPALRPTTVGLPARDGVVSFAFFSNPECRVQCTATRDAQPDVNLAAAARQMATFAQQPGGPGFAILAGNARGPIDPNSVSAARSRQEYRRLPRLLDPFGALPLFAGFGPHDAYAKQPWAESFATAPAPFGSGPAAAGITPVSAGGAVGSVHRYYAFDAEQHGAVVRVIVLDNSGQSLGVEQSNWLGDRLAESQDAGRATVVVLGRVLGGSDADRALGRQLALNGVLAVFSAGNTNQQNLIGSGLPISQRIPQYQGATLGYQRPENNGVNWYSVSIDAARRAVDVRAIPVIDTLALKPLLGLSAARSSTIAFEAIGRRPVGTLATTPGDASFPGYDNYVGIPAPECLTCVNPSYAFASQDPTIGDFVLPSGPGSRLPRLDGAGDPIPSSRSGLFCAYNSGATTVSVTVGLQRASLPIVVREGGIGRPCGTVFRQGVGTVIVRTSRRPVTTTAGAPDSGAPTAPPPATGPLSSALPKLALPFPPPPAVAPPPSPKAAPGPKPVPPALEPGEPPSPPLDPQGLPPITVPLIPPGVQPVPPGGSASAQAAARRKEKVRKHAQQSAYTTRPAGVSGEDWFYPALGVTTLLAALLVGSGMRPGPRPRPVPASISTPTTRQPRRGGRR